MKNKLKPIPEVGKYYHFWGDGKTGLGSHYLCRCERIITPDEAKSIIVHIPNWDEEQGKKVFSDISLYDHWHDFAMPDHDWLFAKETDYFVECSCPRFNKDNLWFVRTKYGGWFSMDIQSWWQGGRLDIDGNILEGVISDLNYHRDPEEQSANDIIIDMHKNVKY